MINGQQMGANGNQGSPNSANNNPRLKTVHKEQWVKFKGQSFKIYIMDSYKIQRKPRSRFKRKI